jgi:alcohol dehydrogenase
MTSGATMRAVVFHEHGGPDVLRLEERWPRPEPRAGETLVEVKAVALNHLDVFVRRGMPGVHVELPHISGGDVAGVVAGTGERVLVDPMVPEGAIGENTQGALAEYVSVPEDNLIPLPDGVSFEQAAALPIAYGTAWKLLVDRGRVRARETVLILGASGGVGTAAVQIAKLAEATVYAGASSPAKLERLRELGADHVLDTTTEDWGKELWAATAKRGVDVVVDYTGRATWPTSIRSLAHGGRLLTCGATSGYEAVTDLRYVWTREQTIMGSDGWTRDGLLILLDFVRAGRIEPVIDRVLPLERAREAEEAIENREVFGKVILTP